jgi:hypothetical protein
MSADLQTHETLDGEKPVCVGQWCCGCAEHPIGKPWGWNYQAWAGHNARMHGDPLLTQGQR